MAEKLTVIIPCKDEEANIRGCIHSARKVADEILIADSGSTDRTLEIVQSMGGSRVVHREYVNSGDFKNWAIPQATHRWVMILDADERIPDLLADEILTRLSQSTAEDGYWIYRSSFFMGHRVRFSGWQNDRVLRLFRRDSGKYHGDTDHAEVVIRSGRVGRLQNRMLHYSYWTYPDYLQRMQRYSTYQALKWQEQGRPISMPKLLFNLPLRFLQLYILRLGFLDGLVGFQVCMLTAIYSFSKQACLWQLLHGRSAAEADRDVADVIVAGDLPEHHHVARVSCRSEGVARIVANGRRQAVEPLESRVPLPVHVLRDLTFRQVYAQPLDGDDRATFHQRTSVRAPHVPGAGVHQGTSKDADCE